VLFLSRDMTRNDLRQLLRRGLATTRGNYRALVTAFGMPASDYKRFMNFLAAHDCVVDFREFRNATTAAGEVAIPVDLLLPQRTGTIARATHLPPVGDRAALRRA